MATGILLILLIFIGAFIGRKKQLARRFNDNVKIAVDYMVQEYPGQYSGDRNAKSGVFIFNTERVNDTLKSVVIKKVNPLHSALNVNLDHMLLIALEGAAAAKNVSVRFKVTKKTAKIDDLKDVLIKVSGVLNFKQGDTKDFTVVLPIAGLHQLSRRAKNADLNDAQVLEDIADLNLSM
ncbi:hypothetical protein ACK8HY_09365 [Sphingobacterium sp. NGMCC 1.201703]|uniref:hypothetical protein n=1 Tax=Sphingobacterium sp. NGMCC 1.201703 TaxID=3388657 RepID=UPI0039FBC3A4